MGRFAVRGRGRVVRAHRLKMVGGTDAAEVFYREATVWAPVGGRYLLERADRPR